MSFVLLADWSVEGLRGEGGLRLDSFGILPPYGGGVNLVQ